MTKDDFSSAHRLRSGRWFAPEQIYMITTVTKGRRQIFNDLFTARMLINIMREDALRGSHHTLAYVLMPDHLHWLLQLQEGSLSGLVGRVKSLAAKRFGRPIWQDGFHDHALRREEDLRGAARYIVANPLRAGLVQRLGDYPHWDAAWL